ncbi:MAG: RecX family transcriptional regulator [Candidatus Kapabacteria bacterium]|nr:RecX family transcriptional regulator [Candidatus Kapabacteria bacterium]
MERAKIRSVKQKNQRSNLCVIEFYENRDKIEVHLDIVVNSGLRKDLELEAAEIEQLINAQKLLTAKQQCYRYAAMKPRTRKQMRQYMRTKQHDAAFHESLLAFLDEFGLIDDMKFAITFINSTLARKSIGIRRMKSELMVKGVNAQMADEAINKFYPQENIIEFAEKAAEKKMKSIRNKIPEKQKSSLANHLIYLGFDTSIVFKVVKKYFK